jgi:hypothetical protein
MRHGSVVTSVHGRPLTLLPLLRTIQESWEAESIEPKYTVVVECSDPALCVRGEERLLQRALRVIWHCTLRLGRASPVMVEAKAEPDARVSLRFGSTTPSMFVVTVFFRRAVGPGQDLSHALPRSIQSRRHRALRAAQRSRNRPVIESFLIPQQQEGLFLRVEPGECVFHVEFQPGRSGHRRLRALLGERTLSGHVASDAAEPLQGLIDRDSVQPRGQRRSPVKVPNPREGLQVRLLGYVEGVLAIPCDAQHNPIDAFHGGLVEDPLGLPIPIDARPR